MGSLANTQRLTRFVYPVLDVYINIGDDLFAAEVSRVVIIHRVLGLFTNEQAASAKRLQIPF